MYKIHKVMNIRSMSNKYFTRKGSKMKKRSLKLVMSLILAMTLVMGMGMSVFATTYDSGSVDVSSLQVGDVLKKGVTLTNNSSMGYARCDTCHIVHFESDTPSANSVRISWNNVNHSGHSTTFGDIISYVSAKVSGANYTVVDAFGNATTHTHDYSFWESDGATTHSKTCIDSECDNSANKTVTENHNTNGANGSCSVCGYEPTTPPTCACSDSEHHIHLYIYDEYDALSYVAYLYVDGECINNDTRVSKDYSDGLSTGRWYYDYQGNLFECPNCQAPSSKKDSKPAEPAKTPMEIREAIEEKLEVAPVTVDATEFNKEDATIIPGATYNLTNFITTKGIVKGINAAVEASNKAGSKTITIYSSRPFCFNETILKTIQDGKKNVTYFFKYKGHLYSVTIPATVDAAKVLEQAGFAGPFYVGQQLGTTKLVK